MTTQTSAIRAPETTLTQQELFAIFAETTVVRQTSYGGDRQALIIDNYLHDGGSEGYAQDDADRIADELLAETDPLDRLKREIRDREAHLHALKVVYDEFEAFKAFHAIETGHDDEEEVPEDQRRYRVPSKSSNALAHPPHGSGSLDGVAFLGSTNG